jgi:hypothetical protein
LNDVIGNQNPATNTGGIDISTMGDVYPAYNVRNTGSGDMQTVSFGPAFAFAPPAGFTGFP